MKNYPGYLPQSHRILWLLIRVALMLWGIYGIFHGSVVEFLEAIFAILLRIFGTIFRCSAADRLL